MAEVRYDVQKALCVCVLAVTNVFYKLAANAEITLKRLCHEKKLKYLVKIDHSKSKQDFLLVFKFYLVTQIL
jgi:hypothetical protein